MDQAERARREQVRGRAAQLFAERRPAVEVAGLLYVFVTEDGAPLHPDFLTRRSRQLVLGSDGLSWPHRDGLVWLHLGLSGGVVTA